MRFRSSFRLLAAVLLAVLLPFVVPGGTARAQTIDNVAEARWTFDGAPFETKSNLYSIKVETNNASIALFRPAGNTGIQLDFSASLCLATNATETAVARANATSTNGKSANVQPTSLVSAGTALYIQVTATQANLDPNGIDQVNLSIASSTGDRENITVYETGVNTGVFIGSIETHPTPPSFVPGDCRLGVTDKGTVEIDVSLDVGSAIIISRAVDVIAPSFNTVFDSETGEAVSGARVTLLDAETGAPAQVFAGDGITPWPSTVTSGEPIFDTAGVVYSMEKGQFWFPRVAAGRYRLRVEPPTPYTMPSVATPEQLTLLKGANGQAFIIADGSFGHDVSPNVDDSRLVDIPLDRPGVGVKLTKTASRPEAQPGDLILYSIVVTNDDPSRPKRAVKVTDTPSRWLRFRKDSVQIDGQPTGEAAEIDPDGSRIVFNLQDIPAGGSRRITYAMSIRADAPPGPVENRATAEDSLGRQTGTGATIEVERETIAGRMTIIGRVSAGTCDVKGNRQGIPGIRVMLEDGSFAVTDRDGRYHFDGVVPGTHVVQVSRMTLPEGGEFIDCNRDTRGAGSAISRFAIGGGGSLITADFYATVPEGSLPEAAEAEEIPGALDEGEVAQIAETEAPSEASVDWIALGDGPDGWLSPEVGHNPRAPAIKVAIRHRQGQKIALRIDGKPVDPLLFEGVRNAEEGRYAVSMWRGVPLRGERSVLSADIINSFGEINQTIDREVFFTTTPAKAELVEAQSNLVADGRTNPVVAIRILDRNSRPLRAGISGELTISAPYQSAEQLERQQLNQLTGLAAGSARWTVEGSDGIALIELAPTMVSGSLQLAFRFDDGEISREEILETWIEPGDIEWTVIGLAEGSVGARTVADNMERSGRFDSDLGDDARVALYAKGRVLGKYLVTLAYDSAKQEEDQRLLGTIDPDAYYTVFGDASSRQFDAASREKLYLRIETASFYALYGDFVTGFDQTRLSRYNRTATGFKGEARFGEFKAEAFAADISSGFRRDEIQGQGITGPYSLSSRGIIANSERVTLEVRDRFRSELIVTTRQLTRFIDYDIDLLTGTISFKEPVLSRDFDLNPQFIVVDYETDGRSGGETNAGVRVEWTDRTDTVRIGATAISDKGTGARTDMVGLDLHAELDESTQVRAEVAVSKKDGELDQGWLVEMQRQTGNVDLLAYARSVGSEYGVGHQNGAELGRTKVGADARVKIDDRFAVLGSIWQDESLDSNARRRAAQIELGYINLQNEYRLGIARFEDRLPDGSRNISTVLEGGATRRLFDNRLELSASTSIALDQGESVDLPTRHQIAARYALTEDVRLVGLYEIADGENISAHTVKGGFEVTPWNGAQAVTSIGKQRIDEFGNRTFAAFGLSQSLQVTPSLTIDATIDGNRTLGKDPALGDIVNPDHPVSSGGQLGQGGSLFEDFGAATLGVAYRKDRWSATARAEYRDGQWATRKGITAGAIRQLGEGSIVGSGLTWTNASGTDGAESEILDAAIALAHRPDNSEFSFLSKLEYRSDQVWNVVAGEVGPVGRSAFAVTGDARSRRLIASLSGNWSPYGESEDGSFFQRDEYGLFLGARYNLDQVEGYSLEGTTLIAGSEVRFGLGERFEIGGRGTVRATLRDRTTSFSFGPNLGFVPVDGALLTLGYNITGFRDEDFSAARQTDAGFYATARMKLDADSLSALGLSR